MLKTLQKGAVANSVLALWSLFLVLNFALPRLHAQTVYPPAALLQDGDITTGHILNTTIQGADINPSAGILWRTLENNSATSTGFRLNSNGRVGYSTTTPGGDFSIGGGLFVGGRSAGVTGTTTIDGTLSVTGNASVNGFTILGSCTGCAAPYVASEVVATTSLAVGDAVFVLTAASSTYATTTDVTSDFTTWDYLCYPSQPTKYAERFDADGVGVANVLSFDLSKVGTPTGTLRFSTYKGDATSPTGNWISTGVTTIASLTTSFATTTINLASTTVMSAGEKWWAVVETENATCDASNYVRVLKKESNVWAGGIANRYSGSWLGDTSTHDIAFRIGFTGLAKMPGGVAAYKNGFLGFATEATATGTPQTLATSGTFEGFTGLTQGWQYYGSTTPGAIGTTTPYGANVPLLCVAASSTACRIVK